MRGIALKPRAPVGRQPTTAAPMTGSPVQPLARASDLASSVLP
jgi:hypothetical protein